MASKRVADTTGAWFDSANLGLFVHWGLSSVHGDVELSWGMIERGSEEGDRSIPPEEYFALAEEFDPDAYDPDGWLRAAREAGMEYAVFTTRHHDGFALWPTEYGDFGVAEYLDGRDLVGEFVEACRRQGLKVGFYYSPVDWHHPDGPIDLTEDRNYETFRDTGALDGDELVQFERFYAYVKGQIEELVTRYGDLDLFWFDGGVWHGDLDDRMGELHEIIRTEQPGIVINDRSTHLGDYQTPETDLPERPMRRAWELCDVWSSSWGYTEDGTYRGMDWTLARLAETVSRGGNLLLNVGPKPDGQLPAGARDRLASLAAWMADNRPAIREADGGPWPERADVPITRGSGVWYAHVLADHEGPVVVRGVPEPGDVRHLSTGRPVQFEYASDELTVHAETLPRESADEVVAITWGTAEPFGRHGPLRRTPD